MKSHQIEFVPADWKMIDKLDKTTKWMEGHVQVLPYYLNEGRIDEKIRTNAEINEPFCPTYNPSGQSISVQFSTGCYYAVCVPLIQEWMGMIGLDATWMEGLKVRVEGVWGQLDQAGND